MKINAVVVCEKYITCCNYIPKKSFTLVKLHLKTIRSKQENTRKKKLNTILFGKLIDCKKRIQILSKILLSPVPFHSTLQTHPCNENRVFPVKVFSQGKTCFHYRDGFAVYCERDLVKAVFLTRFGFLFSKKDSVGFFSCVFLFWSYRFVLVLK